MRKVVSDYTFKVTANGETIGSFFDEDTAVRIADRYFKDHPRSKVAVEKDNVVIFELP